MSLFKLFKNQLISNVNQSEPFYDDIGDKLPSFKELCKTAKTTLGIEYDQMTIELIDSSGYYNQNYIPITGQKLCFRDKNNTSNCYEIEV